MAHPCEQECTRGLKDAPIMIRAIKRYVLDLALKEGWKPNLLEKRGAARKDRVAVVGSGPAGLSCAYDLARAGYQVTVFEAAPKAGGMLRWGIPAYRFNDAEVDAEIASVKALGVKFQLRAALGRDFTLASLRRQGFRAVFLGIGAQKGTGLGIPGEEAAGNLSATDFLRETAAGKKPEVGRRVAVIGGGFTAVDAARTARRLGTREAYILYRRTRAEMPATEEEVWEAEEEGVRVLYLVAPREIVVNQGRVTGIRMQNFVLEAKKDASGRRRPVEVPGTEFALKVDSVISAVGQAVALSDLRMTGKGTVEVDEETLATSVKGVFAGGDCVLGPTNVISAIAQGKRAAASIDKLLAGKKALLEDGPPEAEVDRDAVLVRHGAQARAWRPELRKTAPARRVRTFDDYVPVLTREQAVREAGRCLACGCGAGCEVCLELCKMFAYRLAAGGRMHLDEDKCVACGACAHRCPNRFIEMVRSSEKPI